MGCTSSKIDNETTVSRCKARERFMKHTVESRHELAATHIAYIYTLKNVGAAFRQFAESSTQSPTISLLPRASSQPLPPPPPSFLIHPSPPHAAIRRSISLQSHVFHNGTSSPDNNNNKPMSPTDSVPDEEDYRGSKDYLYGDSQALSRVPHAAAAPPPPPAAATSFPWNLPDFFHTADPPVNDTRMIKQGLLEQASDNDHGTPNYSHDNELIYPAGYREESGGYGSSPDTMLVKMKVMDGLRSLESMDLALVPSLRTGNQMVDVMRLVDDFFLKAYESGKEVGRILEALRIHYHSNFMDSGGNNDNTSRKKFRSRSLTRWSSRSGRMNTPLKGMVEEIEGRGAARSHASTLDRLYAWERKLYEEVKIAETSRIEYERQCALLRRKNARGVGSESIDKTRGAIKSLQTRVTIALQAVDTATAAIVKLRDEELHPQLVKMICGISSMWKQMYDFHYTQWGLVHEMKAIEEEKAAAGTSNLHRQATSELESALTAWCNAFSKAINAQKEYLDNICSWLRLSIVALEIEFGDRMSSPVSNTIPPIYDLCLLWQQLVDQLPDQGPLEAIRKFSSVIKQIKDLQSDEARHKKKVEALTKELERKKDSLKKHEQKSANEVTSQLEHDETLAANIPRIRFSPQKAAFDVLQRKVEEENDLVKKAIRDARLKMISSFQTELPRIFQEVTDFAYISCKTYMELFNRVKSSQYPRLTNH